MVIGNSIYAFYTITAKPHQGIVFPAEQQMSSRNYSRKKTRQRPRLYSLPKNITPKKVGKILDRLNSLNSVDEIISVLEAYAGQKVLGDRLARRILNTRLSMGKFNDLKQIATVAGIGQGKFTAIICALYEYN